MLQKIVNIEDSLKEIQEFFFEAMLCGYASSNPGKTLISGMPGYKAIIFKKGEFQLVDAWCVNKFSQKSAGTTTIFWKDTSVWFMSYGGYYPEASSVISLLKKALYIAYEQKRFFGGRGIGCDEGDLFYVNRPAINNFDNFTGYEEIRSDNTRKVVGFHNYSGMALI